MIHSIFARQHEGAWIMPRQNIIVNGVYKSDSYFTMSCDLDHSTCAADLVIKKLLTVDQLASWVASKEVRDQIPDSG